MTPTQINAAIRKYWFILYAVLTPFIVLMIFNTQISQWVSSFISAAGFPVKAPTVALIQIGIAVILIFVAIYVAQRFALLRCPHCQQTINPTNAGVVIATKNCPNCGGQVITNAGKP